MLALYSITDPCGVVAKVHITEMCHPKSEGQVTLHQQTSTDPSGQIY